MWDLDTIKRINAVNTAPEETGWIPPVYRPVVDAAKRFVASAEGSSTGPKGAEAAALARELADVFPSSIEVSGKRFRIEVEVVG